MKTDGTADVSDAERRALKIGLRLDAIADNFEAVVPMIREALELGDHETLGYAAPGEYLRDRFGASLARLPIEVRREAVAAIDSVEKVSNRSLAPVFDVDQATITRDRRAIESGVAGATGGAVPSASSPAEPDKTTGMDGKRYSKPKSRRRALTDAAGSAAFELVKAAERVSRIADDDRFKANRQALQRTRGPVGHAMQLLDTYLGELEPAGDDEAEVVALPEVPKRRRRDADSATVFSSLGNKYVGMATALSYIQELDDTLTPAMAREVREGWDDAYGEIERLRGLLIERSEETW